MEPPTGLIVERLDMLYEGVRMKGDKDLLEVLNRPGNPGD
ncbi:hypothetical protein ECP02994831_0987 [Escherichia coli P0299483.1]|nr:hypothetical protein ECP02994831_0987 [Escherichia coli P0299483.1]END79118.1 hypothetical protein ECP02994832_2898 [Escherichia coli P0299483.2]END85498.1 hypothetical protein ECP02994833_0834 [Escherichia coli P0299483.3]